MHYSLLSEILKNITGYHTLFGLNGDFENTANLGDILNNVTPIFI